MKLEGKTAVVTGGARGIGKACCIELAREGASIVAIDVAEDTEETIREVEAFGRKIIFVRGDVSDRNAVASLMNKAAAEFGSLDILVNNAAYSRRAPLLEADPEEIRRILDVTLWGVIHCSQLAARKMVEFGRGGNIVCISSVHGHRPYPNATGYNAAKAAVNHISRTWAVELAPHRIRVNAIEPGWTDTPGERLLFTEEQIREGAAKLQMGRLAEPREIARGVVYLVSDDAAYVTGTILRIDGGYSLTR